ncbi:MAG: polysaccharide biosynthesis tyrosine autokinase, partial [Bacteroidota bacterium]
LGNKKNGDFKGKEYYFDEPFILNNNKVRLKLMQKYSSEFFSEKLYCFRINDIDRLAITYQDGLGIATEEKESSILVISRQGTEMNKEMDFINKFIEVYINDGLEKNAQIATNVMDFVDDRINSILDTLIIVEDKLESFQSRSNVDRIDLEGEKLIPEITMLERKKLDMEYNLNYYNQLIDYIQNNDDARGIIVPSFVTRNSVIFSLLEQLISLYSQKMKLSYDITTTNDTWKMLNNEINVSKEIIIENIKAIIEKQKSDYELLNKQIEFVEFKLQNIPSVGRKYFNIKRDYKLNNDLYTYLLKKKAEASIAKGSRVPKVLVLDWATPYRISYVGPNISKIYITSIIAGLVIAGLVVFLLEYFNEKIADRNDLEKCTKIPVLSIVGHNKNESDLVVVDHPRSLISESFRSIRTSINYLAGGKEKLSVLVTSSVSKEGKTFCSINLASAFAIMGKKTVILGADLRKPKIFQNFNLTNEKGITNYLIGRVTLSEIIQHSQYENIDIITAGPIPPNPTELIGNKNMENLMIELKELYDIIIIDTPPLCLVTDSLLLSKYSDVNIYVVRHNLTKRKDLNLINEYFDDKKIQNLGIIVNDYKQNKIGYGWGYTYDYTSYYEEEDKQKKKSIFSRLFIRKSV